MKTLLCLILVGVSQVVMATNTPYAIELAHNFLKRLSVNKPITTSEMNEFFTDNNILNSTLLWQLDYIDEAGKYIKAKPKYSPLGELIRLNFSKFQIIDIQCVVAIEGEQRFLIKGDIVSTGTYKYVLFSDYGKNESTKLNTIIFTYSIPRKKLDFPIFINGQSLSKMLGFEYKNGIPYFSIEERDKLKEHLNKL